MSDPVYGTMSRPVLAQIPRPLVMPPTALVIGELPTTGYVVLRNSCKISHKFHDKSVTAAFIGVRVFTFEIQATQIYPGEGSMMQVERIRAQPEPFSPMHAQRMALWRQRIWDAVQTARTNTEFYIAGTMQGTRDSGYLANLGWNAFHDGQLRQSQDYFRASLHYDPYSISAWVGLSRTARSRQARRAYLQTAIDLQHLVSDLSRQSNL